MTDTNNDHPALIALASLLEAIRTGVLVLAPGLPDAQANSIGAEIDGYAYCIDAAFKNDLPTIDPAFSTAPANDGNFRRMVTALAALLTHGELAMRIFDKHNDSCPPELIFARYHAKQCHEHAQELLEACGPKTRNEVGALVLTLKLGIEAETAKPQESAVSAQEAPAHD